MKEHWAVLWTNGPKLRTTCFCPFMGFPQFVRWFSTQTCPFLFLRVSFFWSGSEECANSSTSWVDENGKVIDIKKDLPGICDLKFNIIYMEQEIRKSTFWDFFCWFPLTFQPETIHSMRSWKKTKLKKSQGSWIFRVSGSTNMQELFPNHPRAVTMGQLVSTELVVSNRCLSEFWSLCLQSHLARVSSGRSLRQIEIERMIKKQDGRQRTRITTLWPKERWTKKTNSNFHRHNMFVHSTCPLSG